MNTQVMEALKFRPVTMDDIEPVVKLFNAYSRWEVGKDQHKAEDLANDWKTPGFNLETDTQLALNAANEPVAYIEMWDMGEPHVKFHGWGMVLPEYQRMGVGTRLLNWLEDRARRAAEQAPANARVVLQVGVLSLNESANALLAKRGMEYIRSFYRMQIDFAAPPTRPQLPEGITIRSIEPGEEHVAIRCAYDSFHDHWGFVEEPFENYLERWMHHLQNDKDYDPSLYFMAMHGNQVAGVSLCYSQITEDPDMGWVGTLGVRKEWRRNGLGLALLQHSFDTLYRRGKPRVGLGVDASSLTGATRLYERAGMVVSRQTNVYEREIRPGIDLVTRTTGD